MFLDFFQNPADIAFFCAIGGAFVLLILVFIISKVVQVNKQKKYKEKVEREKSLNITSEATEEPVKEVIEEPVQEETEEPVEEVVEEPVQEETEEPVKEVVEEPVQEEIEEPVEEVVEEPVQEVTEEPTVVAQIKEEKPVTAKTTKKTTTAKKTQATKAPTTKTATTKSTTKAAKTTTAKKTPAPKPVETPAAEAPKPAGRVYKGKYEVYQKGDGYQYRLKASNGEQLIVSETYTTKDGVMKAIDAVRRNIETGDIKIIEDKHGMFKFKLTSKNYRVLALGSNYTTEKSAVRASESFKKFALKSDIVEIDNPDDNEGVSEETINTSSAEDKTGGKFVIEKFNGEFSWDLKASNGQILCQGNGYTSKSGVTSSIESFKKNVETGSFKIVKDKNGNYHYNLYTASGRVAATGEAYNSRQLAESAALSVVSYYKNAEVNEKK